MSDELKKVIISIADIPVEISGNKDHLNFIARGYPAFLCHLKPIFRLSIHDNPSFVCPDSKWCRRFQIKIEYSRGIVHCCYKFFNGRIAIARRKAFLELGNASRILNFDLFFRVLYANILASQEGALLHSATLTRNNSGYLFLGESGAGKTTVAKSAIGICDILNEDMSIIRKVHGEYRLCGSPFFGSGQTDDMFPVNKSAPLKAAFRLIQAEFNAVEEMNKKEALCSLVRAIRLLPRNKPVYKTVIGSLLELVENVPMYKLYFTKKCNFWRLMP